MKESYAKLSWENTVPYFGTKTLDFFYNSFITTSRDHNGQNLHLIHLIHLIKYYNMLLKRIIFVHFQTGRTANITKNT